MKNSKVTESVAVLGAKGIRALLLITGLFISARGQAIDHQSPSIFYGPTKLEGYCIHTQNHQVQKLMEFTLVQDPKGGKESKYEMVPGTNAKVTVEYESNGAGGGPVKYYHARFLLHSFNGDLEVFKERQQFEYLDHNQRISASFEPKSGVQIKCEAGAINVR